MVLPFLIFIPIGMDRKRHRQSSVKFPLSRAMNELHFFSSPEFCARRNPGLIWHLVCFKPLLIKSSPFFASFSTLVGGRDCCNFCTLLCYSPPSKCQSAVAGVRRHLSLFTCLSVSITSGSRNLFLRLNRAGTDASPFLSYCTSCLKQFSPSLSHFCC